MILAQLHGSKPEYTGVVAGMSGSPVYIGNRLLGSISYHIGNFAKDAIAGITPIQDMLEVRDIPIGGPSKRRATARILPVPPVFSPGSGAGFSRRRHHVPAHGKPVVMSGFQPAGHPPLAAEDGRNRAG